MKNLKVRMTTMSEWIDKLTEENRALQKQTPVPATQPLPPPPAAKAEMDGASNPTSRRSN